MKAKVILYAILFLALANSLNAQILKVNGGLNTNFFRVLEAEDEDPIIAKPRAGFHGGILYEYFLADRISLETGAIINTRGGKWIGKTSNNFNDELKYNIIYTVVPVSFRFFVSKKEKSSTYLLVGPYSALGLKGVVEKKTWWAGTVSQNIKFNSKDDGVHVKRFDYGINLGIGFSVRRMEFATYYDFGLANIFSNQEYGQKLFNRSVRFSAAYYILDKR